MKNNRAFTLVELMAVIIIISLIALLTFPNIIHQIKKTKKINNDNINTIVIEAAKKYFDDNKEEFNGNAYYISIEDLIDNDYVKEDIVKKSGNDISEKYVLYKDNKYQITDSINNN